MKQLQNRKATIRGVGINDLDEVTRVTIGGERKICREYALWKAMLQRAYDPKCHEKRPTYADVTVCKEWLSRYNFTKWLRSQDNYQDWLNPDNNLALDKDILDPTNKEYSPEKCVLIPNTLNSLLVDSGATRGDCPQGVSYYKCYNKLRSQCCNPFTGKIVHLGYFALDDVRGAYKAYVDYKVPMILASANHYKATHKGIHRGLLAHAQLYTESLRTGNYL